MAYNGVMRARKIAYAVCKVFSLSLSQLISAPRSKDIDLARGIYCYCCWKDGIHPTLSRQVIQRSRANMINIGKRYRDAYEIGDRCVIAAVNKVIEMLEDKK